MNAVNNQISHESIRKYTIPKANTADKANLVSAALNSRDAQDLLNELPKYQKEANFNFRLEEINSVEFVRNSNLNKRYSERRTAMRKGNVVREKYAFAIMSQRDTVEDTATSGLKCRSIDYSGFTYILGDREKGIHLFRKPDVALMHYGSVKGFLEFGLVVFKVLLCKGNRVVPQKINDSNPLEPQPDFDYHFSTHDPFIDSLIYIYEYDENEDPRTNPLSILPFAVVNYKLNEPFLNPVLQIKKRISTPRPPRNNPKYLPTSSETADNQSAEAANKEDDIKIDLSLIGPTPPKPIFIPSKKKRIVASRSMRLVLHDIILHGWNLSYPISHYENRNVLLRIAPSSSRALAYLRRAGRTYSSHPAPRLGTFDLVNIVRQLPVDSNLTASFHLVIGFLKFYINTATVHKSNVGTQTELENSIDKCSEYLEKMAKQFTECVLSNQKLAGKLQKNTTDTTKTNDNVQTNEIKHGKDSDNGGRNSIKATPKAREKNKSGNSMETVVESAQKIITNLSNIISNKKRPSIDVSAAKSLTHVSEDALGCNGATADNQCTAKFDLHQGDSNSKAAPQNMSLRPISPIISGNTSSSRRNQGRKMTNLVDICLDSTLNESTNSLSKNSAAPAENTAKNNDNIPMNNFKECLPKLKENNQIENIEKSSNSQMNDSKESMKPCKRKYYSENNSTSIDCDTCTFEESTSSRSCSKPEECKTSKTGSSIVVVDGTEKRRRLSPNADVKKREYISKGINKMSDGQRNSVRSNFSNNDVDHGINAQRSSSQCHSTGQRSSDNVSGEYVSKNEKISSVESITKKLIELSESGSSIYEAQKDEKILNERSKGSEIIVTEANLCRKSSDSTVDRTKDRISGNFGNEKFRSGEKSGQHLLSDSRAYDTWNTKYKSSRKKSITPDRRNEDPRRMDVRKSQPLERDGIRLNPTMMDCRSNDDSVLMWRREIEKIKDQLRMKNQRLEETETRRKHDSKYDSDDDDDEHFILRLILHSITEGSGHRLSNRLRRRLKSAFFFHLRRIGEIDLFERDRLLVELASCAQRGHWKFCLDKLEVPRELFSNHVIEKNSDGESDSGGAGEMWRDTLLKKGDPDHQRSRGISPNESREVSRYADDVFSDTLNREVHVSRKRRVSSPAPKRGSIFPPPALSIPPPSFFSIPPPQFLFSSGSYGIPIPIPRLTSDYRSRMLSFYHAALQR